MEHIHHIRYEFNKKGKSIRAISKETGHNRETVRKIIQQQDFSVADPIKPTRASKTDMYRDTVRQWLIDDQLAPRKQHHTARKVYKRLKKEQQTANLAIEVSERAIRSLVAELRKELGQNPIASLPLLHPAGGGSSGFWRNVFLRTGNPI